MKSKPTPYVVKRIQIDKARKGAADDPDLTLVYSFFAESEKYKSCFKYIIRAEKFKDCYAIKYYCTRAKHSDYKYSRVLNFFSAVETKRLMVVVASIIPEILTEDPLASFAFNGSRTYDRKNYIEGIECTQRYRIYIELVRRLFGDKVFYITNHDRSSACIFVNRRANRDVEAATKRIFEMFADIFRGV